MIMEILEILPRRTLVKDLAKDTLIHDIFSKSIKFRQDYERSYMIKTERSEAFGTIWWTFMSFYGNKPTFFQKSILF